MTLVPYTSIKIKDNNESMVDLNQFDFILDPKYFQQGLSTDSRMFARKEVALKLEKIQKRLKKYRFKIWDAYRSREVQNSIYQKYWNEVKNKHPEWDEEKLKLETRKFVTAPYDQNRIPPHATGGTIDITLVDKDGQELDMGTKFDFFGPEAATFYYEIYETNKKALENRRLLREIMLDEDFALDEDEWWHFDYGNQMWALKKGKPFAFYGEVSNEDIL